MEENAYFTIEASLILSIVFFVFYFVIYIGFYQYNRCLLEQDIYRLLIRAEQTVFLDNKELLQEVKRQEADWYYEKYAFCHWKEHELKVGKGKVEVAKSCSFDTGLRLFPMWTKNSEWAIAGSYVGKKICPEQIIRDYRKVKNRKGRNN